MKQFSHAASIFPVEDPGKAARYYADALGFDITFSWGDPPEYVVTNREEAVSIHFVKKCGLFEPSRHHNTLYVFVHDVDQLYQEFLDKEVDIISPPVDHEYGMRDFDIKDPDGYILSFGTHVERPQQQCRAQH